VNTTPEPTDHFLKCKRQPGDGTAVGDTSAMLMTVETSRILVADDQPDLVDALRLLLKPEGIVVDAVHSPDAALAAVQSSPFDLVLMDLNYTGDTTSGREGIDLLEHLHDFDASLPIVVMTGWGSIDLAVEAMRRGVRDFVQKPWDNAALLTTLRSEIQAGRERRMKAERDQRELEEARRIQRTLLPAVLPQMDGFELAASWQPASGVGGDCFDAIRFSSQRLALSIADVVGKGIPAALLMSNLQAAVRAFATEAARPEELCERVNTILCGHISEGRFISFFYCVVDSEVGSLTYANAGHFPPALIKADGTLIRLTSGGPVLGVLPAGTYESGSVGFGPGDRLILYTDGITEARSDTDEEFGDDRLLSMALEHRACSAPALQARLVDAVATFTGRRFTDDATLIVLAADK
jgi:sigma-B regulation protein RsbU (phosphoserine phosphatase)